MDHLAQNLRFTVRYLAKHRGMTAVIALSLALGIGANTAIFSLIRSVMLRDLPVQDPKRLVLLYWGADAWPEGLSQSGAGGPKGTRWRNTSRSLPFPFFREIATDRSVFSSVFAFAPLGVSRQNVTLAAGGAGERVDGEMISGDYFRGLGVSPAAGRLISRGDEEVGAQIAVLSHSYWMRRFAADPDIVGTSITINSVPFSVVGVAEDGFFGVEPGRACDVWITMVDVPGIAAWGFRPAGMPSLLTVNHYWWVQIMARLNDGVDERQAAAALDSRFQMFGAAALPAIPRDQMPHLGIEPGGSGLDAMRSRYEGPLYVLLAVTGLVLMIACANVALLLLSASTARRREFALRLSLGARRGQLVRQLFTESVLMAALGGSLGLLLAGWASRGLLYLLPSAQRPLIDSPIDAGVLGFAAAASLATALLFGIVPALIGTRVDLVPALKQSGTGTLSGDLPTHRLWSSALVVVQIALSLVLVVGAALFARTIAHLYAQPLGVDTSRLLVFGLDATQNGYVGDRLTRLYGDIVRRLQALPGVEAASAARNRLFSGWVSNAPIWTDDDEPKSTGMVLYTNAVGPAFAHTVGLRVLAGRDISWGDVESRRQIAVVNEAMAEYFFGGVNAVGRRFRFSRSADPAQEYEIVGVVSNAKYSSVRGDFPRTAYLPYTANRAAVGPLHMMIRTAGDPARLAAAARDVVRNIDPNIAIVDLDRMDRHIGDSLWREQLFAGLTSAFGGLALALACIGLYGTIAYGVGRRRPEIAVRVALGAARSQILWMVLRRALLLAALGIAVGVPLAWWSGRFISAQLFGVAPHDPSVLAFGSLVLALVAALAGYLPARRATQIEPATALSEER